MSDVPPWLADAVEAAAMAHCAAICGEGKGCETPCPGCLAGQRAALAAFLRRVPNVSVMQARAPGQWHTTRTLADAIERLGAPETPDAP